MTRVNLGLIGVGGIGKSHLSNGLLLESAKVTAVCDLSKKSLAYARKLGIKKLYTDFEKILNDKDIDAVIISLPTHLHKKYSQRAAEVGKHVFLEKPLARNESEGKDMVKTIERNGVKAMVGYPLRFATSFVNAKKKINSGTLGEIQIATATNVGPGPLGHTIVAGRPMPVSDWYFDKELSGGGALMDLGVHLINALRYYFGEIVDSKAFLGYRFNLDVEDHAICVIRFKEGPISTVNVGWFSSEPKLEMELVGTLNHLSAFWDNPPRKSIALAQRFFGKNTEGWSPHYRALEYFVECLKHDFKPYPTFQDALKDLEVISSAYRNNFSLNLNHSPKD